MGVFRDAVRDAISVVLHGIRIIGMHFPVLLTIYLLGAAGRGAAIWGAVVLSKDNSLLGALLVPLAPVCTLTALILMLRAVSPSLHFTRFDAVAEGPETPQAPQVVRERLALLASTLVPFLAVYAAQGYLKEDTFAFVNAATADEFNNNTDLWFHGGHVDAGRAAIASDHWLWGIVAVAFVLRWLVNRFDLPSRNVTFGLAAAWFEVTWVTLFAHQVPRMFGAVKDWIDERVAVVWAQNLWHSVIEALGPVGGPVEAARAWFWGVLGDFDAIVIIPVAWLTVGAIVYGRTISSPSGPEKPRAHLERRLSRLPGPVGRWVGDFVDDFTSRFAGLAKGLRTLAVAGLVPMLLFCLVFVLALQAKYLTYELVRVLTGPLDPTDSTAFSPWMDVVAGAVYTLAVVGLLAAAVDRVIRRQGELAATAGVTDGEPDPVPVAG